MSFFREILEFDSLRALVERHVASPSGHALMATIEPHTDRAALEQAHAETAEAIDYLQAAAQPQAAARGAAIRLRFDSLPDPEPHLAKLAIAGVSLEGLEVRELANLLDRACDVRAILTAVVARFPRLARRASRIGDFRTLLRELSGKIEPDGSVADGASVALGRVRRDMERQQRLIQESLERFIKRHRDDGILQEEFIAIRNERFVLPVAAGHKRKVDGVIHAASGTGHTLFIEPMEAVELNNDLARLREQERREVLRILAEITDLLRQSVDDIRTTVEELAGIEVVFAKARFAEEFGGTIPRFGERLAVAKARHPMLVDILRRSRRSPVPLSLDLGGATRTLLISGPNTGGKTVSLKTIGAMVLMAQSGLPVCAESAELPLFEQVLADIGDQQSIEQSLSTFSAHVTRLNAMLALAGPRSLVLLDEIGRATDPDEGGALGVAVIDHVRRLDSWTLASTHLLAPKIYGATTEGVLNASMSFDRQTLAPTYEMRIGVPGASAGLDIAGRLGLPAELVDRARASLSDHQRDLARLLSMLEQRIDSVASLEAELAEQKARLEAERTQLATLWEKRESAKLRELERRTDEAIAGFENRARRTIEEISQATDRRKAVESAERKVSQARREMREEAQAAVSREPAAGESAPLAIAEGARVRLRGVREVARVKRLVGTDVVEVESGFLKLQVSREDVLEVLPDTPDAAKLPKGVTMRTAPRPDHVVLTREINLIGRRAEEAMSELDKFLDSAALASVGRVRIVHGHGMGILKGAVAELLRDHPLVAKFHAADQYEGGAGATIAEMRG
jgi:DNA mismatch repair protein MutS2